MKKRLKYELGIPEGSCQPRELFSFVYYAPFPELCEYEFDHVFLAQYMGEIVPEPGEISEVRWVEMEELEEEMLRQPEKFCSWFIIAAPKVMELLKKRRGAVRQTEKTRSRSEEVIAYLCRYMERHLEEDLSLEGLAQKVSVSKYHLSREFKKYTGMPPVKYLICLRLEKAKKLLTDTELTISEIAEKVGFSDINNFTNHFKKNAGMTPRNYRYYNNKHER